MENQQITNKKIEISRNEKIIIGILSIIVCLLAVWIILYLINHTQKSASDYYNLVVETRNPEEDNNTRRYVVSIDGTINNNFILPSNLGTDPEWSPDGKWIVSTHEYYSAKCGTNQSDIYIMRADGSWVTFISSHKNSFAPSWSSDGRWIVYSYDDEWSCPMSIPFRGVIMAKVGCHLGLDTCLYSPDTSFELIKNDIGVPEAPVLGTADWAPGGSKIVYAGAPVGANSFDKRISHVIVMNTNGNGIPTDLTPDFKGLIFFPSWSPDGTKIIGYCIEKINSNQYIQYICEMNSDGSNFTKLDLPHHTEHLTYLKWSPDGKKIAFVVDNMNERMINYSWPDCANCYYPEALFVMNADGSHLTRVKVDDYPLIDWITWYPYK